MNSTVVVYLGGLQANVNALWGRNPRQWDEFSALVTSILDKVFKDKL